MVREHLLAITRSLAWTIVALSCAAASPLSASTISFSLGHGADQLELRARIQIPDSEKQVRFAIGSAGLRESYWLSRAKRVSDTVFELGSQEVSPMRFRVLPDSHMVDRVYQSFVAGAEVGIVNLDYWILEEPLGRQAISASFPAFFIGSDCETSSKTTVDRGTDDKVAGWGRYVVLTTDDSVCRIVEGLTVIDTGSTPQWIREFAITETNRFVEEFAQGFEMVVPKPTLYLHADLNPARRSEFCGEVAWRHSIVLRFLGDAWTELDNEAANKISRFVAHEVLHLWLGGAFSQADETRFAWFHEGAAEYLSLSVRQNLLDPSSQEALGEVGKRFRSCLRILGDKTMKDRAASRGSAPYDCGYILQWLVDLHDRKVHDRSIWERWRGYLASLPNREISWDGFLVWGASEGSIQALVSPMFEPMNFDDRAAALRARLADFDLRIATPTLDNPRTIRRLVVFHLLGQACTEGNIRFTIQEDGLELDTEDRCGALSGNPRVRSLDGYDLLSPGADLHSHVGAVCEEKGELSFADTKGAHLASVLCEKKLRPLPRGVLISHAWAQDADTQEPSATLRP